MPEFACNSWTPWACSEWMNLSPFGRRFICLSLHNEHIERDRHTIFSTSVLHQISPSDGVVRLWKPSTPHYPSVHEGIAPVGLKGTFIPQQGPPYNTTRAPSRPETSRSLTEKTRQRVPIASPIYGHSNLLTTLRTLSYQPRQHRTERLAPLCPSMLMVRRH